ncbi:MAG: alanine dehydrogenase [Gammaproteobacteria bacterium]|nr:alanine dehydrogenase [Gammaproteobacteria bacterium]
MIIGLPKEIKDNEYRVALTPGAVKALTAGGRHCVLVEAGAGLGSAIADDEYVNNGAKIVANAEEAWAADLVVKVKEPVANEYSYLRQDLILFTYLHLAANKTLTQILLERKVTAVAYETVQLQNRQLPLLKPMSEVAGRMATQVGAYILQKNEGGRGVLMGGVPGVAPANVVVLGGGTVGANAARIAVGMGAQVTLLDINHDRLTYFDDLYNGRIHTRKSNLHAIAEAITTADLVIGAVLLPGEKTPWLITKPMLKQMKAGSVIVDVAVDQGGCVETSKPTTHSHPTFEIDGVVHYCVANMPGAVPRTSTFVLVNETLEYALMLADQGLTALRLNSALQSGLNTFGGHLTHQGVASAFGMECVPPTAVLTS